MDLSSSVCSSSPPMIDKLITPSSETTDDLTSLAWLQDNNLLNKMCFNKNRTNKARSTASRLSRSTCRLMTNVHSGQKPAYSYSSLIYMAIESSPHKAMMVSDIYKWLINNFPYFMTAPTGWKNNIRHTLSLRKCFKKVIRSRNSFTEPVSKDDDSSMKGAYWYVDENTKASKEAGHCIVVCKPKYEMPKFLASSILNQIHNFQRN